MWLIVKALRNKTNISSYRAVSLVIMFCKISENIISKRVMHHLNSSHIPVNGQFALAKDDPLTVYIS
jgi:hypothetical protein